MPLSLIATLCLLTAQAPGPAPSLTPRDSAFHALNRLAYGARPSEADSVARFGVMKWIERQLDADHVSDTHLAEREREFKILDYDRADLAGRYRNAIRERQRMQREMGDSFSLSNGKGGQGVRAGPMREFRELGGELQLLAIVRAALSERQLREVMVDFWTNHFNVFVGKGADRFLLPSYIEETIRPRALGRFEDLLSATAQSPAMLFYLDNAQSVAPGSEPPRMRRFNPERMPRGINENYARELLELHTLGVDGGYTQQDVINVARIFTGWSIERPERGAGFVYRDWAHDQGDKQVLGYTFKSAGKDEGIRLLKFLANQHATMHHVSAKLCARFVADEPPDGCIDAAVAAWQKTRGDMRAVLRAIVTSPDFWSAQAIRSKVKTPFEFVVSAVRATGVEPDNTPRLAQLVGRLGEPLYQQAAPTGYAETEAHWVNSGALLARMNAAMAIAKECSSIPTIDDHAQLVDVIDDRLLAGTMSAHTRSVILEQLTDITDPEQARVMAVGLALGGPDFQRQ
jgi:uncharacterized protein (DUF1800 family)